MFQVGQCESPYRMGFLIGRRFSDMIRSRLSKDPVLQNQLLPWAKTSESHQLIEALTRSNRDKYPEYWDELVGLAEGSGAPFREVCFLSSTFDLPEKMRSPNVSLLVIQNEMIQRQHSEAAG